MFIYTRQSTGRLFLLSVPQNIERIKMIGGSITNLFTETKVSTLDELLRWHWDGRGRGDSHLQWAGLVKSHVETADSAHIYTWLTF